MLSQIGERSNQLPSINGNEQKSPYLLQYKVFEDRLKKQQKKSKNVSYVPRNKKAKSSYNDDYIQIAKNIINKKENVNIFDELPCETEPSINYTFNQQLTAKTRSLFEKNINKKKNKNISYKQQTLSQTKQNSQCVKSRVQSESIPSLMRDRKHNKNECISFLGYKKNKKPILELGFKKFLNQF